MSKSYLSQPRRFRLPALALSMLTLLVTMPQLPAQAPAQQQQKPPDQAQPDSGGPAPDNGSIAIPKKKDQPDDTPPPAPAQPKFKNPEGAPSNYSLRVEVPEVTVDVGVLLEKTGQFVPGLKPSNFRVYEDGVEQKISGFKRVEAPITALLLCEFSSSFNYYNYYFLRDMQNAAWEFAQQLRPQDYVALMTFDMRTQIWLDFTQDKRLLLGAIQSLVIPG